MRYKHLVGRQIQPANALSVIRADITSSMAGYTDEAVTNVLAAIGIENTGDNAAFVERVRGRIQSSTTFRATALHLVEFVGYRYNLSPEEMKKFGRIMHAPPYSPEYHLLKDTSDMAVPVGFLKFERQPDINKVGSEVYSVNNEAAAALYRVYADRMLTITDNPELEIQIGVADNDIEGRELVRDLGFGEYAYHDRTAPDLALKTQAIHRVLYTASAVRVSGEVSRMYPGIELIK